MEEVLSIQNAHSKVPNEQPVLESGGSVSHLAKIKSWMISTFYFIMGKILLFWGNPGQANLS
jgi:hypothetical protein